MATIRSGRPEDVDAVLALWRDQAAPHAHPVGDADSLAGLLAHDRDALLVAEADGRVTGALVAAWDGWRGNMYRLAVDPAHRRRGIGRDLVRAGERRLAARGARRITALVAHDDAIARELWSAAGYEPDRDLGRMFRNLDGGEAG